MNKNLCLYGVVLTLIVFGFIEYKLQVNACNDDFGVTQEMLQKQSEKLEAEQNRLYKLIK